MRKTHWSRQPKQLARDRAILKRLRLGFEETQNGCYKRSQVSKPKAKPIQLVLFQEANIKQEIDAV